MNDAQENHCSSVLTLYKYTPDGQATNYIVIAKVPRGVSLSHKFA